MARAKDSTTLRRVVRISIRDIRNKIPRKVEELNSASSTGRIQQDHIRDEALKFEEQFAPLTRNLEELALGLVSVDWVPSARALLEVAGSLISSGQGLSGLRFATGLPAYFGWRLLLISGARSVQEETFGVTASLVNGPIPVIGSSGQPTYRSLVTRRDLFHPETLLGHADFAILQFETLYERSQQIRDAFGSSDEFLGSLSEFLMIVALRDVGNDERPLYPGYRLLSGFRNACGRLMSRLVIDSDQLGAIAEIFDLSGTELKDSWPELASKANTASLGSGYWNLLPNHIPTTFETAE